MSRKAIIPLKLIPEFCPTCGHKMPESERLRQTHPFVCSNPEPHRPLFISPFPVTVHMLFVRLPDVGLGICLGRRGLRHEAAYEKWSLPSGFIEAETGFEAAVDEFYEELLVDISGIPTQHVDEYYDPDTFCSLHFYAGLWQRAQPPQLQITRESSEVMICPVGQLPADLAFPYQADIIQRAALRYAA